MMMMIPYKRFDLYSNSRNIGMSWLRFSDVLTIPFGEIHNFLLIFISPDNSVADSRVGCLLEGGGISETTLGDYLNNASFVPESPVTAAYLSGSNEEGGTFTLYTADGFRHVYDYTELIVSSNGSNDSKDATSTVYYHYNAERSQNISAMFAWGRVDAAAVLVKKNEDRRFKEDSLVFHSIEISGYSLYQNGTYMGEILPPCEREGVSNTGKPELLIRKN